MGQFKEKIKEHFWMLVSSSVSDVGGEGDRIQDENAFKDKFQSAFIVNAKEAMNLVDNHIWKIIYSDVCQSQDPNELMKKLNVIFQVDVGKLKEHIWNILLFSVSKTRDEKTFRQIFEPIFKINPKEAIKLVEDHLWKIVYSEVCQIQDSNELRKKLDPIIDIDTKNAAEIIKRDRPEKYELLLVYK